MLKNVFSVKLEEKILPRRVTVGRFDGVNPCLVAATAAEKVLVHNPHSRALNADGRWVLGSSASDVNYLNVNQTINSLAAGNLSATSRAEVIAVGEGIKKRPTLKKQLSSDQNKDQDVLVIGTPTALLVYDVVNNRDLFYREIPDGANAVAVGRIGTIDKPLAVAGGNCALQGFDATGDDCYWTVTGDNITALALADINGDGQNELIVGSDDHDIRIFKEDAIAYELSETEAITGICPIGRHLFAYSLSNGTVGVYRKKERLWRIKSKNQAHCLFAYDVNHDDQLELVTGWSNGKIDVRVAETGEVLFKENLPSPVAGIVRSDYNLDGVEELVIVTVDGELRGYVAAQQQERQQVADANFEQETIRDLMKRKQNLMVELRNYEENIRIQQIADPFLARGKPSLETDQFGAIPANTQLKSALVMNPTDKEPSIDLILSTTNDTVIRGVVVFSEGIFAGESMIVHPVESQIRNEVTIQLRPPSNLPVDLHVKALVGYRGSFHYHVFELTRNLPRFAMFAFQQNNVEGNLLIGQPNGRVEFTLNDQSRVLNWVNECFLLVEEVDFLDCFKFEFLSMRDGNPLILEMDQSGHFVIQTDSMQLAGDLIQSLVDYLGIEELHSVCQFAEEMDQLRKLIEKVDDLQRVKQQLATEVADNAAAIRTMVVRAEDARIIGEIKLMKQYYIDLMALNNDMFTEYRIRCQNHQDLVDCLKKINVIIQRAGNLRAGHAKTRVIQACRNAIKQNNLNILTRIISSGEA